MSFGEDIAFAKTIGNLEIKREDDSTLVMMLKNGSKTTYDFASGTRRVLMPATSRGKTPIEPGQRSFESLPPDEVEFVRKEFVAQGGKLGL